MGKRVSPIFGIIIAAVVSLYFIVTGAAALSKGSPSAPTASTLKGELCEIEVDGAIKVFEIKNTVDFIPAGKEHYYLMTSGNDIVPLVVRAKPSWIEKHFDEDGNAVSGSVTVKGIASKIDSDVKSDFNELNANLSQLGVKVSSTLYIDARYKEIGIMRVISGVGLLAVCALIFIGNISGVLRVNKLFGCLISILLLAVLLFGVYTIIVGS